MPKAKDKTKKRRVESDEEEPQASQQSQGRGKGRKTKQKNDEDDDDASQASQKDKLSGAELERKVAETTRYLLFADRKKIPIKRGDITKNVLREHSKAFAQVMELTKKQLKKVFGIEVAEIEGAGKTKAYILLDDIDVEQKSQLIDWGDDSPKMALLMVVLSLILMSDNVVNETILWYFLKKLGLQPKTSHEVFGDPDKLIQEFARQGYLEKKKVVGGEESTFEYRWGPRSYKELTKRKVLGFVSEIYGTELNAWTSQIREIEEEERRELESTEK